MGKKKSAPSSPRFSHYEEMKDTPWITQNRDLQERGYKGLVDNYNNVNVFDKATNQSIDARNADIYRRAFDDMERNYTNTMNKYAANNYNRFGTLNATPASFVTDDYQRQFQRQMNDLSFNKAMNYDKLKDLELNRRYNTLDMYNNLFNRGATAYNHDKMNWNTRNSNVALDNNAATLGFLNNMINPQQSGGWMGALNGAAEGASAGAAFGPWGALGGAIAGGYGGSL